MKACAALVTAHSKVMVLDAAAVIPGSFNFSAAAERSHAENLLVTHDPGLAALYARNWAGRMAHSELADPAMSM